MMKPVRPVIRATRAVIDLNAISHNIAEIRKKIGSKKEPNGGGKRLMVMDTAPSKSVRPPSGAGADCLGCRPAGRG